MKKPTQVILTTLLVALSATVVVGQDRERGRDRTQTPQFNEHDQQVAHDWYNQHQSNPPRGFRNEDRLSNDEESRIREGEVLDRNLRRKMYSAPPDLYRQMPPPPSNHRYVAIGNHVALIDHGYHVKAVIHLHDNH